MTELGRGGIADASRLTGIANVMDRYTLGIIDSLELPADARIVDVGAGTGSVAAALGRQCPQTSIVALDRDISIIHPATYECPNVTVVETDVAQWVTHDSFDLVHSRFVLSHLPDRDTVAARLCDRLIPGGWLMLTEPYQLEETDCPDPAVGRVLAAYRSFAENSGSAMTWIRRTPALLTRLGLTEIDVHVRAGRLGGATADRWSNLIRPVADRLHVTPADLAHFYNVTNSPGWQDIPQMIVTVIARTERTSG